MLNKIALIFIFVAFGSSASARETKVQRPVQPSVDFNSEWQDISKRFELKKTEDRRIGLSYVISGSVGLAGGIAGALVAQDEIEKGIYSVFQTIGVAAIGYGSYTWLVGDDDRAFYEMLQSSGLAPQQKVLLVDAHYRQKKDREKRERLVKAITHGLIAGLNIYSAQQQSNDTLKTGLLFIGGVNLLACVSYTFEF